MWGHAGILPSAVVPRRDGIRSQKSYHRCSNRDLFPAYLGASTSWIGVTPDGLERPPGRSQSKVASFPTPPMNHEAIFLL